MRLTFLFISFLSLMTVSVWAYNVNYKARSVIKSVKTLSSEIQNKEARIKLLKAEWTYLNRPERLNRLVTVHFPELRLLALSYENYLLFEDILLAGRKGIDNSIFEPARNKQEKLLNEMVEP